MQTKKQGFTLIELLVVIVIIGILATIAIPQFTSYFAKARDSERKAAVNNMATIVKVNVAASADGSVTYNDYSSTTLLNGALSSQGYTAPTSSSDKCYYYAYNATDFFVAAGLEETAGTIAVAGTGAGVTEANIAASTAALAADNGTCATVTTLDAAETTDFTYVGW